ncbi:MAG: MFS transporter [Alphaproteobacteria bacterium]|nr:MAG: MFS transporter [Alphaproteobacteria bacterium]
MNSETLLSKKEKKAVSPEIWKLSIAVMLAAVSTTMTFSVSPMYMKEVLGFSLISIGVIEGLSEGLSQLSKLMSGVFGDYFRKRKPPLILGFILAALSKPLFILAGSPLWITVSKLTERISNGLTATPRDAFVADESTPENRGASFGVMMTLKTIGCAAGSFLIGGMIFVAGKMGYTVDYKLLLWIGFVPCLVAVYMITYTVRESAAVGVPSASLGSRKGVRKDDDQKLRFADVRLLSSRYWMFLVIASLFMLARFADGLLVLRMQTLGAPIWICAMVIGIFNIVSSVCCFPIGDLSDRMPRAKILYFSFVTLILSHLCFYAGADMMVGPFVINSAYLGIIFWGAQRGTSQILFSAIISEEVPPKVTGTALGIFNLTSGMAAVAAGYCAGYISDDKIQLPFLVGAIVAGVALVTLIIWNVYIDNKAVPVQVTCTKVRKTA